MGVIIPEMTEREYKITQGIDIEPITRREMYYKAIMDPSYKLPGDMDKRPITRLEMGLNNIRKYVRGLDNKGE